ncbi:MAG: hypothetical protein JXR96_15460 [Deltaproteobacteria bacterium]|nr:hypothetical protein [Deltaproteobacteria bacterium]
MRALRVACLPAAVLALVACSQDWESGSDGSRRWAFRAIGGFSMGSITAAKLGLRYHPHFDIIAPMGGALDMGYYMHVLKDEVFSGFCSPPEPGRMCPDPAAGQDYEHMDCGGPAGGGFDREDMIKAYLDAAIAMGNFMSFHPDHPYLPAGMDASRLALDRPAWCAEPLRLTGFYDWRFNPDGAYPVISFCEGDGPEQGIFDPEARQDFPVELTYAVDLDDNGRRDSGEPVLFWAGERFEDVGEDGLASAEEPGYDPQSNPDPAGDDYQLMDNPFGTEGNHAFDEGEPYLDFGLDGVEGTADSPYDFGEGNGYFDYNPNIVRMAAMHDPARLLKNVSDAQLDRLDFYIDAGIRDHLRFCPASESFAGILMARGRPVDFRDTFASLLEPGYEGPFDIAHIDWPHIGRDVMVRYGKPDATQAEIDRGDGGHVGNGAQVLWRFFASAAYVSARWPDGDFEPSTASGRVFEESYESEILGMPRSYWVYLPPGYDEHPDRRYPVLYLIHGIGMQAADLSVSAEFCDMWMQSGQMQKFIMIFPDGRCGDECFSGTFFANQAGRHMPPRRYEDSFVQELLPHIDAVYRTRPEAVLPREAGP